MRSPRQLRAVSLPLLLATFPWLSACGGSSGSSTERVTLYYDGSSAAYGVSIRTGTASASSSTAGATTAETSCTASAVAEAAGCAVKIEGNEDFLHLALYGCPVEPGDPLFDCDLPPEAVEQLRGGALVSAGCGCQAGCARAPGIVVCGAGEATCEQDIAQAIAQKNTGRARIPPDVVVTSHPATGETTCSTCCETDFYDDEIVSLVSDRPVSEVAVQIIFANECAFDNNGTAECDPNYDHDYWDRGSIGGSTLVKRLCLAAGVPARSLLAEPILSCRGNIIEATVTYALDEDFKPLDVLPKFQFD